MAVADPALEPVEQESLKPEPWSVYRDSPEYGFAALPTEKKLSGLNKWAADVERHAHEVDGYDRRAATDFIEAERARILADKPFSEKAKETVTGAVKSLVYGVAGTAAGVAETAAGAIGKPLGVVDDDEAFQSARLLKANVNKQIAGAGEYLAGKMMPAVADRQALLAAEKETLRDALRYGEHPEKPEDFKQWLADANMRIVSAAAKLHEPDVEDPVAVYGKDARRDMMRDETNQKLLLAFQRTRDPGLFDSLMDRVTRSTAAAKAEDVRADVTAGMKPWEQEIMDYGTDPVEVATTVISAGLGKIAIGAGKAAMAGKALTAGQRAAQAAKAAGILAGDAGFEAASEALTTILDDPNATKEQIAEASKEAARQSFVVAMLGGGIARLASRKKAETDGLTAPAVGQPMSQPGQPVSIESGESVVPDLQPSSFIPPPSNVPPAQAPDPSATLPPAPPPGVQAPAPIHEPGRRQEDTPSDLAGEVTGDSIPEAMGSLPPVTEISPPSADVPLTPKPPQTITGSNVRMGTEMPVQSPTAQAGAETGGAPSPQTTAQPPGSLPPATTAQPPSTPPGDYQESTALKNFKDRFKAWTEAKPLIYRRSPEAELDSLARQMLDENDASLDAVTADLLSSTHTDLGLTERQHIALMGNAMMKWEERATAAEHAGTGDADGGQAARNGRALFQRLQTIGSATGQNLQAYAYIQKRDPLAKLRGGLEDVETKRAEAVKDKTGMTPEEFEAEVSRRVAEERAKAAQAEVMKVFTSPTVQKARRQSATHQSTKERRVLADKVKLKAARAEAAVDRILGKVRVRKAAAKASGAAGLPDHTQGTGIIPAMQSGDILLGEPGRGGEWNWFHAIAKAAAEMNKADKMSPQKANSQAAAGENMDDPRVMMAWLYQNVFAEPGGGGTIENAAEALNRGFASSTEVTSEGQAASSFNVEAQNLGDAIMDEINGRILAKEQGTVEDQDAAAEADLIALEDEDMGVGFDEPGVESWEDRIIRESGQTPFIGIDPKLAAAYTVKGAKLLKEGFDTLAGWTGEMLRRFGEAVRPYLRSVWDKITTRRMPKLGGGQVSVRRPEQGGFDPKGVRGPRRNPFADAQRERRRQQRAGVEERKAARKAKRHEGLRKSLVTMMVGQMADGKSAADAAASVESAKGREVFEDMDVDAMKAEAAGMWADMQAREAPDRTRKPPTPQKLAERAVTRMAEQFSDTPTFPAASQPSEFQSLLSSAVGGAVSVDEFAARAAALGVDAGTVGQITGLIKIAVKNANAVAAERAGQELIKGLKPRAPRLKRDGVNKLVKTVMAAGDAGILSRPDFLSAFEQAFGIKNHLTPKLVSELKAKARAARSLPVNSMERHSLEQDIIDDLALASGMNTAALVRAGWYGNILSAFGTQLMNVAFNAMNVTRLVAQASGDLFSGDFRSFERMMSGAWRGGKAGAGGFMETMRTGRAFKGGTKFGDVTQGELAARGWDVLTPLQKGVYMAMAQGVTRRVMRFMAGMDVAFNTLARESAASMAAGRKLRRQGIKPGTDAFRQAYAREMGLESTQWAGFIAQAEAQLKAAGKPAARTEVIRRAVEMAMATRPEDVQAAAGRLGDRITGQQTPEGVGAIVSGVIGSLQKVPIVGPNVVPFNKIVSNFFSENLDWTGAGIVRAVLGQPMTQALNRAMGRKGAGDVRYDTAERLERAVIGAAGVAAGMSAWGMAQAFLDAPDDDDMPFMVYGFGPENKGERAAWMAAGNRPFSIRMGSRVINYSETVLAFPMAIAGSLLDKRRYGKKQTVTEERASLGLFNGFKAIVHFGPLGSGRKIVEMMEGRMSKTQTALQLSGASGLIPLSSAMREAEQWLDPAKTSDETIAGVVMAGIPGLSKFSEVKLDRFGRPEMLSGLPGFRRLAGTTEVTDPVVKFMLKNNLTMPGEAEVTRWPDGMAMGTPVNAESAAMGMDRRGLEMDRLWKLHLTTAEERTFRTEAGQFLYKQIAEMRRQADATAREGGTPMSPEVLQKRVQVMDKVAETIAKQKLLERVR